MSDNGSNFISRVVLVAFREVRDKLEGSGRMVYVEYSGGTARIMVVRRGKLQLSYRVTVDSGDKNASPVVETRFTDAISGKEVKAEPESLSRNGEIITAGEATPEDIIENFNEHYLAVTKGR